MKKTIAIILVLLLLLPILASCSRRQESENNEYEPEVAYNATYNTLEENENDPIPVFEALFQASSEVMQITSFDGYTLTGRLTLPEGEKHISTLVIFVNGSGANTYLNRRVGFNFFDIFADEFLDLGVAFFSHNTRGVRLGNRTPMFFEIDEEAFKTYLPLNSVEDIYYMINALRENERLQYSRVLLLGSSEGTIIAPLVAEKYPNSVDGLLLWGYANQNMKDILVWQNTGGPSMVWYRAHFETDELGRISRDAYYADPDNVRESMLQNATFEDIDHNNDSYICEEDFALIWPDIAGFTLDEILSAIERGDDEWIRDNYGGGLIPLTSGWFLEHFSLRSNMEVLPGLDLPIYIFHGVLDQNVDVREVFRVYEYFQELGKTNLIINVFENHNHDLNFMDIVWHGTMPEGIQAIFDAIARF